MDLVLIRRESENLEFPNCSVDFSDHLRKKLPEMFCHDNIMYYSIWEFEGHLFLSERPNNQKDPLYLSQVFGLEHELGKAGEKIMDRAKSYAKKLQNCLLLEHGIEAKLYLEIRRGNLPSYLEEIKN